MTDTTPLRIAHHTHLNRGSEPLRRREHFERILDGAANQLAAVARRREAERRPRTSPTSAQQTKEER